MKQKLFPLAALAVVCFLSGCNYRNRPPEMAPGPSRQSGAPTIDELKQKGAKCVGQLCTMPDGQQYDCKETNKCIKIDGRS
jgi:hypothetical protein